MKNLLEIPFEGAALTVIASPEHEWLIDSATVAAAYGIKESGIRMHKIGHKSELILNKHFIEVDVNSLIINGVSIIDTPHNGSLKTFWTKKGVVRLGFFIKSEQAAKFRDFAEDLVVNGVTTPPTLILPTTMIEALRLAADQMEARIAAEEAQKLAEVEAQKQKAIVQELAPKATYTDKILTATNSWLTTTIADELGMSAVKLNQELEKRRVQRKVDGKWVLYAEHQGKGYTDTKTFDYVKPDRTVGTKINTVWTERGRYFIHNLLNPVLTTALKPIDE